MSDSAPSDPSRRPSDQVTDAIPIPEADARSKKARTVRIQDILAAHARALDVRLEEGMREMRLAMEAAVRRSDIHEVPASAPPPPPQPLPAPVAPSIQMPAPPPAPIREDVAKGLAQQTEERFQALALRLQRIEDAVRTVALSGGGGELGSKIQELTEGMDRVAATEEELFDRFLDAQRAGLEDLTRRVGAGVAAVIRAMQTELSATITRLELTADATVSVAPDDAARLERTMMAIAERQEEMLDGRLAELRDSIAGVQPQDQSEEVTEAPVEESTTARATNRSEADREAARQEAITSFEEHAWPWPEPDGTAEEEQGQSEAETAEVGEAEATEETPEAETAEVGEAEATEETPEAETAEVGETEPEAVEETPEAETAEVGETEPEAVEEPTEPEAETAEVGEAEAVEETPEVETEAVAVAEENPTPKKRRRRRKKQKVVAPESSEEAEATEEAAES